MISRRDMADDLALGSRSPTRTYVVEADVADSEACLRELADAVEATEDVNLNKIRSEATEFWVDRLDARFWRFHTKARPEDSFRTLRDWVNSRHDLDWMWLPSQHLSGMWPGSVPRRAFSSFRGAGMVGDDEQAQDVRIQATGPDAESLLEKIRALPEYRSAISIDGVELEIEDQNYGVVREAVKRNGAFAATGDDFGLHQLFVSTAVSRYRTLLELCERKAISWQPIPEAESGAIVQGAPVTIQFSRTIADLEAFAEELVSCAEPFRLWGTATQFEDIVEIEAVDLHVGQKLNLDVASTWMRVYLMQHSCGNVVARLISNLQHRFDADLTVSDPQIAAAIGISQTPAGA
jgi:hypothetical protein